MFLGRGDLPLFNPGVLPLILPLAPKRCPRAVPPYPWQRHACSKCEPTRAWPNCSHNPPSMTQRSTSHETRNVNKARLDLQLA